MKPFTAILPVIASGLISMASAQSANDLSAVVAPGAKLEKLAGDFKFTEGPTADKEGNIFFTDQPNNRIMKWSVYGKLSTFLQPAGRANGMFFDSKGNLIACADEKMELWSITPDGEHTVLAHEYEGKPINSPNDVWVRSDGSLFFTDPFYKREWWTHDKPSQGTEQVYFLSADRKTLKRVTADLAQPNGIIGTPDGKKLYVNKWYYDNKGGTWVFDIKRDGTLTNMRKFSDWGGDGMSMDELGNVYISNGEGVMAFDPDGNNILKIPTGGGATNNTFAGRDGRTLFITGPVDKVTAIRMRVKGAEFKWRGRD